MTRSRRWWLRFVVAGLCSMLLCPLLLGYVIVRRFTRRPVAGAWAKFTGAGSRVAPGAVLVHGVSLGETALMRPLVPRLESLAGVRCLLTTTTETGWAGLEKAFADRDRAFLPYDLPWAVWWFLRRTKPRAIVLLEAEFWPVWLACAFALGIPVVLVNARMSDRSYRRFAMLRPLVRPWWRAYAAAAAQNRAYAARLRVLGCAVARTCGSLKADLVRPAEATAIDAEGARIGLRRGVPVLLLASTSGPEERAVLGGGLVGWSAWQIIIGPRHPERGGELAELIRSLGGEARRTSLGERLPETGAAVLIVDEIGRLGALYGWTAREQGIAVVGGSLGSGRGGQNMLEAAAARCATVVGWDTRSQPDSMALLRGCGGVAELSRATLVAELAALAADPARRQHLGDAGHGAWLTGQGAIERVMCAIGPAISGCCSNSNSRT